MFTVRKRESGNNPIVAMPANPSALATVLSAKLELEPTATYLVSRSTERDNEEMGEPYQIADLGPSENID